jgi:GT2 family glycosyltransferase
VSPSAPPHRAAASILIVGYRAYDELERCLASIARFEPAAEVIVFDNAADPERAPALAARFPRVRYEARSDNPGFAAAVNAAARLSSAPLLIVLNPDTELTGPLVPPLAATLTRHPSAGVVGGLVRESDGSVQMTARTFPDIWTVLGGRTSWLTRVAPSNPLSRRNLVAAAGEAVVVDWVAGACMMIRREVFDALGGFDDRFFLYWEDADFCRRAQQAGWQTVYEPSAEVMHATARASRHAPVRALAAFHRSVVRYYWQHGSRAARLCAPLVVAGLALRFLIRLPGSLARSARPASHADAVESSGR